MRQVQIRRLLPGLLTALLVAAPAFATTIHGDYSGTNYDFNDVQETSTFGDPEPLFEAPSVVGDSLLFFP